MTEPSNFAELFFELNPCEEFMKKTRKIIPSRPEEKGLIIGPEESVPPELEDENPEPIDPSMEDAGNPPPTKPVIIKK